MNNNKKIKNTQEQNEKRQSITLCNDTSSVLIEKMSTERLRILSVMRGRFARRTCGNDAHAYIAAVSKTSISTVKRTIQQLKDLGVLHWDYIHMRPCNYFLSSWIFSSEFGEKLRRALCIFGVLLLTSKAAAGASDLHLTTKVLNITPVSKSNYEATARARVKVGGVMREKIIQAIEKEVGIPTQELGSVSDKALIFALKAWRKVKDKSVIGYKEKWFAKVCQRYLQNPSFYDQAFSAHNFQKRERVGFIAKGDASDNGYYVDVKSSSVKHSNQGSFSSGKKFTTSNNSGKEGASRPKVLSTTERMAQLKGESKVAPRDTTGDDLKWAKIFTDLMIKYKNQPPPYGSMDYFTYNAAKNRMAKQ
jgi:hypothetical protein